MIAVVRIGGKQYTVQIGDTLVVDRFDGEVGKTVTLPDVLLVEKDGDVQVGTPTVSGATVSAKVLNHDKGEKIEVRRFKAKSRYRRKIGFRPHQTTLEITAIGRG